MKYKQVYLVCNQHSHQNSLRGRCKGVHSSHRPNVTVNICFSMINALLTCHLHLRGGSGKHLYDTHMRSITYLSISVLFYRHLLLATDVGMGYGDRPHMTFLACILGEKMGYASKSVGSFKIALEWHTSSPSSLEIIFAWSGNGVEGKKNKWWEAAHTG